MTVTSGFFNSLNHDRKYDTRQISQIFDGIIEDGVYMNIYNQFKVTASEGLVIQVDTGRSWFNHAWTLNDSILLRTLDPAEILFDRIDAVVIRIDHTEAVRSGDIIEIVKGTPSANPVRPTLQNGPETFQHPLAYITVPAEATAITQENITNMVGTSECPFVTGAAQGMNIDMLISQWQSQWNNWFNKTTSNGETDLKNWMDQTQFEFNTWFEELQTILDGDVAANLTKEVLALKDKFKTLVREYTIYDTVDDTSDETIQDSEGNNIEGGIIYVIKN